MVMMYHPIAP